MTALAPPVFPDISSLANVAKDTVNSLGSWSRERAKPQPSGSDLSPYQLHGKNPDDFKGNN